MTIKSCVPIIPSSDLEKSLRFWVDGLGFTAEGQMMDDGKLVGCMVHNDRIWFWLNQRAGTLPPESFDGVRLYWTPDNLDEAWAKMKQLGFKVSAIEEKEYGQKEFFVMDDDGYSHCFGVSAGEKPGPDKR
ncbi:MAG TPA: VOC family protein [Ohtaekwangia sp.]